MSSYPIEVFKEKTSKSHDAFQRAIDVMPGGVTANIKYFEPYPIIMEEADGAWLTDIDGNKYVTIVGLRCPVTRAWSSPNY